MSTANNSKIKKIFGIPTDKLWVYPVFFGTIFRLFGLTSSSIWHDEGYTMWLLRYNPIEIISRTARDVHPPGYYLIAKLWVSVFGNSVFAIRTLSVLFSLGIIYLVYKIVEKLFNDRAAFWASMFVALSPFMVRFAQEARMYGIVAFFTTLGTYFLVRWIKDPSVSSRAQHSKAEGSLSKTNERKGFLHSLFHNVGRNDNWFLIYYALSMTAAIYTQYYAFFVIMVQWIIVASITPEFFTFHWGKLFKKHLGIFNYKWWLAGLAPVVLYLPWFPIAYKQVTRVSGSYWIRPEWITVKTIPNNITQFLIYTHLDGAGYEMLIWKVLYWVLAVFLIGSGFVLLAKKDIRAKVSLFLLYGYLPMILVFILSKVKTPVYQDRYFPFSAVAILALWGIAISILKNNALRITLGTIAILILVGGNFKMHMDTNHQMKALSEAVKKEMRPGDIVLSGELYTFLDGTYYFGDKNIKLISNPVDGYGESSLFYDQQKDYIVSNNQTIALGTDHRIFIVGKTGDKKYFSNCLLNSKSNRVIYEENNDDALKAVLYSNE